MRLIVAGSRKGFTKQEVFDGIEQFLTERNIGMTQLVSGDAVGVDTWGCLWATKNDIPIKHFPAQWYPNGSNKLDRSAGPKRNSEMASYADGLIAFWDGKSPGTKDMITKMEKQKNKFVKVYIKKQAPNT
jgi:hypothetical protein